MNAKKTNTKKTTGKNMKTKNETIAVGASDTDKAFTRGFALALTELNRRINMPSSAAEVLDDAGYSMREFRAAGVEKYDLNELAECFKESKRARRRRKAA